MNDIGKALETYQKWIWVAFKTKKLKAEAANVQFVNEIDKETLLMVDCESMLVDGLEINHLIDTLELMEKNKYLTQKTDHIIQDIAKPIPTTYSLTPKGNLHFSKKLGFLLTLDNYLKLPVKNEDRFILSVRDQASKFIKNGDYKHGLSIITQMILDNFSKLPIIVDLLKNNS